MEFQQEWEQRWIQDWRKDWEARWTQEWEEQWDREFYASLEEDLREQWGEPVPGILLLGLIMAFLTSNNKKKEFFESDLPARELWLKSRDTWVVAGDRAP